MDALGHVNNTVYFRYMEQARLEWLYAQQARGYSDTGPVIVNASCTFLVPVVYPGEVEVRMYLGDIGRSSIGSFYELFVAKGERAAAPESAAPVLCSQGAAKIVWIDTATGRSVPLPEHIVAPLRALAGDGTAR